MSPSCTPCVPSCSLFPRDVGGKVMLPPLTSGSSHGCATAMTKNHAHERLGQEPPKHRTCTCHREGCMCPESSFGRPILRNEPAGNCFDGLDLVLRRMDIRSDADITGRVTFQAPRKPFLPPRTLPPPPQVRKTISRPITAVATVSPPTDVTTSQKLEAAAKADLTSKKFRTFRLETYYMQGQKVKRRKTRSRRSRSSSSDTDGSLKEITITQRSRKQFYKREAVLNPNLRLLRYVDCRSLEYSQELEMDET